MNQLECTYIEVAKKCGPPKGYVESLENWLEKMEGLLQRIHPPSNRFPTLTHVINSSPSRLRSSVPEQTLRQSSALPSNVTSGLRIPLPFPPDTQLVRE